MLTSVPEGVLAEVAKCIDQDDMLDLLSFSCACKATRGAALYSVRQWTVDLANIWRQYTLAQEPFSEDRASASIEAQRRVLLPLARMAAAMRTCGVLDLVSPGLEVDLDPTTSLFRDCFFNPAALDMTLRLLHLILPAMPGLQELLLPAMMPAGHVREVLAAVGACQGLRRLTMGVHHQQMAHLQQLLADGGLPQLHDLCLEVGLPQPPPDTTADLWDYPLPLPAAPALSSLTLQLHAWSHPSWLPHLPAALVARLVPPPAAAAPLPPLATLCVMVVRSGNPPVALDLTSLPPLPHLTSCNLTVDALPAPSVRFLARQKALSHLRLRTRIDYPTPLRLDPTPLAALPALTTLCIEDVELTHPLPLWPTLTSLSATHISGAFSPRAVCDLPALHTLSLMDIPSLPEPLLWDFASAPAPLAPPAAPASPPPAASPSTHLPLIPLPAAPAAGATAMAMPSAPSASAGAHATVRTSTLFAPSPLLSAASTSAASTSALSTLSLSPLAALLPPPLPPTISLAALTSLELCGLPLPRPLPPLPCLASLTFYCILPPTHPSTLFASAIAQPKLSHLSLYHKFPRSRITQAIDSTPLTLLAHLPALRSLRLFEANPHHLPPNPHLTSLRISKHLSHPRAAPAIIAARYPSLQDLGLPATHNPPFLPPPPPSALPRPSPWLRSTTPLSTLPHLASVHVMAVEGEYPEATPDRSSVCRIAAAARRALPPAVQTTATLDDFVYPSDANIPRGHPTPTPASLVVRLKGAVRSVRQRLQGAASAFTGCYKPCVADPAVFGAA